MQTSCNKTFRWYRLKDAPPTFPILPLSRFSHVCTALLAHIDKWLSSTPPVSILFNHEIHFVGKAVTDFIGQIMFISSSQ